MHCRDVYLADFLKTNLSKIAVICVRFLRLDKLQNHNTNKGKRKSCGFSPDKNRWTQKGPFGGNVSKIRLDIHFVVRHRACVALSSGLVNVTISCKIVPETSSK